LKQLVTWRAFGKQSPSFEEIRPAPVSTLLVHLTSVAAQRAGVQRPAALCHRG
jgi:hypothetical protein